jgi:hypothetical protein
MPMAAAAPAARVQVEYRHPEKFADARDLSFPELTRYLERRAAPLLRQEERLQILFTDIDRAGEREPWRRDLHDVRIVRNVYPPRIDLSFRLIGADGAVLKEGQRTLRDAAFMISGSFYRDDPLRCEKALLEDWLERELQPPAQKR